MAHKVNSEICVFCGSCADACPAAAISFGSDSAYIDSSICIDCGSCTTVCPVAAISGESEDLSFLDDIEDLELDVESEFNELGLDSDICILKFYADWCGPCRAMSEEVIPIFEENHPNIEVVNVNIDSDVEMTKAFEIMSVPTLVFLKNDEEYERLIGFQTIEQIEEALNRVEVS